MISVQQSPFLDYHSSHWNKSTVAVHQYNHTQHPCPAATRQHVLWLPLMSPNTVRATKTSPHAVYPGAKLFQPIRMTSTHIFCPTVDKNLNILAAWLWPCAEHTLLHQQENPFFSQRCSWMQEGWGVKKRKKEKCCSDDSVKSWTTLAAINQKLITVVLKIMPGGTVGSRCRIKLVSAQPSPRPSPGGRRRRRWRRHNERCHRLKTIYRGPPVSLWYPIQ